MQPLISTGPSPIKLYFTHNMHKIMLFSYDAHVHDKNVPCSQLKQTNEFAFRDSFFVKTLAGVG